MPLDNDDLKKIHTTFVGAFDELWKTHLEPNMVTKDEFEELKTKIATQAHVNSRFDGLEKLMQENAIGASVQRDRKLNEKTNVVAQKLDDKSVFTRNDVRDVERISHVAVSPTI